MKMLQNLSLLVLLISVTTALGVPSYRLVSGERGVILSIDNVTKEPTVHVELIDGNLTINIPGSGVSSSYAKTYSLGKKYWADSIASTNSNGVAQLVFYNFRLSIEDMQKKFTKTRFLLLISPSKSEAFDNVLFVGESNSKAPVSTAPVTSAKDSVKKNVAAGDSIVAKQPIVNEISIVNRDGLEFVTISGSTLNSAKVIRDEKGISVDFGTALKLGTLKNKFPVSYLVDSSRVSKDGLLHLYFKSKDGNYSFASISENLISLVFSDTREYEVPVVMGVSKAKTYKYVVKTPKVVVTADASNSTSNAAVTSVVYLIKDNVNIRRTPVTTSSSNIIGKFAFGARFVSESKDGEWFKIRLESGEEAFVSTKMAQDSTRITVAQWDAIHNSSAVKAKPVVDEFNSPGSDPLLNDKQKSGFKLDSASAKQNGNVAKQDSASAPKEVVQIKPYKKMGRDPFLPLTSTNFVKPKMPKVDKLTLVGVIYDPRDGIALFDEVVNGKTLSFSMRVGEKVENGKLLKIYERKVVFLMQESDFTYTIEKELLVKKE